MELLTLVDDVGVGGWFRHGGFGDWWSMAGCARTPTNHHILSRLFTDGSKVEYMSYGPAIVLVWYVPAMAFDAVENVYVIWLLIVCVYYCFSWGFVCRKTFGILLYIISFNAKGYNYQSMYTQLDPFALKLKIYTFKNM